MLSIVDRKIVYSREYLPSKVVGRSAQRTPIPPSSAASTAASGEPSTLSLSDPVPFADVGRVSTATPGTIVSAMLAQG